MAINTHPAQPSTTDRFLQLTGVTRLRDLVDNGAIYVPQSLNPAQFATLYALLSRIYPQQTHLAASLDSTLASSLSRAFDCRLGLDELDSLAHIRTGFAFADLTPELQDAILSLISTRDLTARRLDLSVWLMNLQPLLGE